MGKGWVLFLASPPGLWRLVVRPSRLHKRLWIKDAGGTPAPQSWRRALLEKGLPRNFRGAGRVWVGVDAWEEVTCVDAEVGKRRLRVEG